MKRISPEEAPGRDERDIAEAYCRYRELPRPDMSVRKALLMFCGFELSITVISLLTFTLLRRYGLPDWANGLIPGNPGYFGVHSLVSLVLTVVFLKKILIILIRLYQRYAPEDIRRRCTLMPTCSEYAILALCKYGIITGLYKIYIRLFQTCQGNREYRMDYP